MLQTILITTELTIDGIDYEVDARSEVFVSDVVHYWETGPVEIECNERVILFRDLPECDRKRILDLIEEKIGESACV